MTEEQPDLITEITKITKLLEETNDKLTTITDEILEAIEETQKNTLAKIEAIATYQKTILEPNQRTIYEKVKDIEKIAEGTPP
jgi:TRAP-type mannitol/chloroaromatic compound transport system substrate-binding protein